VSSLLRLGWSSFFQKQIADEDALQIARVVQEQRGLCRVAGDFEGWAEVSGRFRHGAGSAADFPAVGDWVGLAAAPGAERATVHRRFERRSTLSRKAAGRTADEQIVAANVDVLFIVMALDEDFSLRRLERYLLMTGESGATPIVLLTKPDLVPDPAGHVASAAGVAGAAPVYLVCPVQGKGLEPVVAQLTPGMTGALVGSSGVGKTTIINRLVGGAPRRTRDVRASDSKGRHTTTHRELIPIPGGGLIIDTPGMRELQLWDAGDAMRQTFDDIEALAAACHFGDCRHRDEPRCAVKAAVADARLPASRLESYLKLQDELVRLAQLQDERALIEEKRRGKIGAKALRAHLKTKR